MILKPNIFGLLTPGAWRAGLTRPAAGTGVIAGIRSARVCSNYRTRPGRLRHSGGGGIIILEKYCWFLVSNIY
jgi:hypothetical protein